MHRHHPPQNNNNNNSDDDDDNDDDYNINHNNIPKNPCCSRKKGEISGITKIVTKSSYQQLRRHRRRRLFRKEEGIENVVWIDGWILKEPWQYDSNEDWVAIVNEVQNLLTGILFLLVVRRIVIHLLRIRYRSNSID